jgi:hypothetical protein
MYGIFNAGYTTRVAVCLGKLPILRRIILQALQFQQKADSRKISGWTGMSFLTYSMLYRGLI